MEQLLNVKWPSNYEITRIEYSKRTGFIFMDARMGLLINETKTEFSGILEGLSNKETMENGVISELMSITDDTWCLKANRERLRLNEKLVELCFEISRGVALAFEIPKRVLAPSIVSSVMDITGDYVIYVANNEGMGGLVMRRISDGKTFKCSTSIQLNKVWGLRVSQMKNHRGELVLVLSLFNYMMAFMTFDDQMEKIGGTGIDFYALPSTHQFAITEQVLGMVCLETQIFRIFKLDHELETGNVRPILIGNFEKSLFHKRKEYMFVCGLEWNGIIYFMFHDYSARNELCFEPIFRLSGDEGDTLENIQKGSDKKEERVAIKWNISSTIKGVCRVGNYLVMNCLDKTLRMVSLSRHLGVCDQKGCTIETDENKKLMEMINKFNVKDDVLK